MIKTLFAALAAAAMVIPAQAEPIAFYGMYAPW